VQLRTSAYECVEEAKQLDLRFPFIRVGWRISNRAGECRSELGLSSKSEKRKVEAVAGASAQDPEDFNAFGSG
jgi:hypothetical protein